MLKTLFRTFLMAGLLLLAACRMAPVYNVQSETLYTPQNATLEDVTEAIKRAGLGLGWQLITEAPGSMTGRLSLRPLAQDVDADQVRLQAGHERCREGYRERWGITRPRTRSRRRRSHRTRRTA